MLALIPIIVALIAACLTSCSRDSTPPVQNLGAGREVSGFVLKSCSGTRDGDRLDVRAVFGDGSGSTLSLTLQFKVTPPTRLESGTWSGLGGQGSVRQRSVTFLGGQSGPPSIGGRFDLIGTDSQPVYRVTIPLQQLQRAAIAR